MWCDGVLWPAGSTPKLVEVTFEDIEACVIANFPAPNYTFILAQREGVPCGYDYEDAKYKVNYTMSEHWTQLSCWENVAPNRFFFRETPDAACELEFDNEFLTCTGANAGKLGTGTVLIL